MFDTYIFDLTSEEIINIIKASEILNVSKATVRNWIKSKLLPEVLTVQEVEKLKLSIEDGSISKLNKRANKLNSKKSFIPSEYITNQPVRLRIKKINELSKQYFKNLDDCVYNLAVCFLISKREIFELFGFLEFERNIFQTVITAFGENKILNLEFISKARPHFIKLDRIGCHDTLGILYQSIRSEGVKSKSGSYYTPIQITEEVASMLSNKIESFYDPCCGTGSFLLSVAKNKNLLPENIYGTDIDPNAVFITKINLLLHFKHSAKEPNIYCIDILSESHDYFIRSLIGKIDAIATNPPWGANKNENLSEEYKTLLNSNEIFSMFILKSYDIIKERGECIFLLPEAILNIKAHANIRQLLSTRSTIISIKEFGRAFSRVFTSVILIHFKKEKPVFKDPIVIYTKLTKHEVSQKRFVNTKDYIFDINITTDEKQLIKKIYSIPHKTLKDNAKWALGVISGNNNEFISSEKTSDNEPIYKGSDITYYKLNEPVCFIKYKENKDSLQQVAKEELYRAKNKLVYKFISNKLVFAYDSTQRLTLNSANILIPAISGYGIKSVLAFLNSSVLQFLFSKKFATHKVLRNDLEQLPFPNLTPHFRRKIEELVDKAIKGEDVKDKIDEIIFKVFDITTDEIRTVKKFLK